jgi:hypothetical protein
MSILAPALVALVFIGFSLRPLTSDTRSLSDYRAFARHVGPLGCLLGALRVALVAGLLVLNDVCRLCLHAVEGARIVLGALAYAVAQTRRPAVGGA